MNRAILATVILVGLAACGGSDPTDPGPGSGEAELFAGGIATDSVDSEGQISVRVNGPDGPAHLVLVQFRPVWLEDGFSESPFLLNAGSVSGGHWLPELSLYTQSGNTQSLVRFGSVAGSAGIAVFVPSLGLADTVLADVLPGAPDTIDMQPADTMVYVGDAYAFGARVIDRHGNAIPGLEVEPAVIFGDVEIDGATIRALGPGLARLLGQEAGLSRNLDIAVVPQLTLAYAEGDRLVVSDLAGLEMRDAMEHARTAANHDSPQHAWSPDGLLLAYTDSGRIYVDDLAGNRQAIADGTEVGGLSWTGDGQWLYFNDHDDTWRAATDGSGVEFVTTGRGQVSPDGSSLALYRAPELLLYDLGDGSTDLLHDQVRSFGWAPDGSRLFVSTIGGIEIIDTSGSVLATIDTPPEPSGGTNDGFADADFSPDGRFLVAEAHRRLYLADLERQRVFPFPLHGKEGVGDPSLSPQPLP